MKKIVLVLSLFFVFTTSEVLSQESISITYKEKRVMTDFYKKNLDNYPPPIKNKFLKEFKGINKRLLITGDKSVYSDYVVGQTEFSEKAPDRQDGTNTIKETVKVVLTTTKYYKDLSNKDLLTKKNVNNQDYIIKESLNDQKWEFTDEVKKINQLTCKKAISKDSKGRAITAWYTEDLALNNGPAKYGGLPGLIVYLESYSWIYEMQGLKKSNSGEEIELPSTKDAITMEEFRAKFNPRNKPQKTTTTTRKLGQF